MWTIPHECIKQMVYKQETSMPDTGHTMKPPEKNQTIHVYAAGVCRSKSYPRSPRKGLNNSIPESYGFISSDVSNGIRTSFIQAIGPYIILIRNSYRICGHSSIMGVHSSNNPIYWKWTDEIKHVECQYAGLAHIHASRNLEIYISKS